MIQRHSLYPEKGIEPRDFKPGDALPKQTNPSLILNLKDS